MVAGFGEMTEVSGHPQVAATVTNPNTASQQAPTSAAEKNRKFLDMVLVWPDQGPGWTNLHVHAKNKNPSDTSPKNNGGKPYVVGWPLKTVCRATIKVRQQRQSG
jgi:hypothetical protein